MELSVLNAECGKSLAMCFKDSGTQNPSSATRQVYAKVPSISGFSISPDGIRGQRVQQRALTKAPSLLTSQLSKALQQDLAPAAECNDDEMSDFDSVYSDDSLDEEDQLSSFSSPGSSAPIPVPVSEDSAQYKHMCRVRAVVNSRLYAQTCA